MWTFVLLAGYQGTKSWRFNLIPKNCLMRCKLPGYNNLISMNRFKSFFIQKNADFGCYGGVNVDVHCTTTFKC